MSGWLEAARLTRVIAGVKSVGDAEQAIASPVRVLFFLTGTLFDLRQVVGKARAQGKHILAHIDLVEGVGKDRTGMEFLSREIGIDGLLTTRTSLVRAARELGIPTVQRVFLLDSESLKSGLAAIASAKPDAVEVLPALVLPAVAHRLPLTSLPPLIAGGLVQTEDELRGVLRAGAAAVSTTSRPLFDLSGLLGSQREGFPAVRGVDSRPGPVYAYEGSDQILPTRRDRRNGQ